VAQHVRADRRSRRAPVPARPLHDPQPYARGEAAPGGRLVTDYSVILFFLLLRIRGSDSSPNQSPHRLAASATTPERAHAGKYDRALVRQLRQQQATSTGGSFDPRTL
jgi:hypothetical protein